MAITAVLAGVAVGVAVTAGTRRRVILYGDSLAFEARDAFALALQRGNDIEVVDRTFGGTAICAGSTGCAETSTTCSRWLWSSSSPATT